MSATSSPGSVEAELASYDPYQRRPFEDQTGLLAEARATCPVAHSDEAGGFWLVTRYEDVQAMFGDPGEYSSRLGISIPRNPAASVPRPPIDLDPPLQRDFRRLLNPLLSPAALAPHRPAIHQIIRELVEPFADDGEAELVEQLTSPLPALVLARVVLGLEDEDAVYRLKVGLDPISQDNRSDAAAVAWRNLYEFSADVLDGRRDDPPTNDIVSVVLHGTVDGRPLTRDEQVGTLALLVIGGLRTTTHALGNVLRRVVDEPTLEARLRRPGWVARDLDEFLRLDPPLPWIGRTVVDEITVHGRTLCPGERVMLHLGSANHDGEQFEDPDSLRFDREQNRHVTFGLGAHRCIGLHLARLSIEVAVDELFSRVTNLRWAGEAPITFKSGISFGPAELPVTFDPFTEGT